MPLSHSTTEILNRAKSYPYWIPRHSYIFYNGSDYPFQLTDKLSLESSKIYWQEQWISMPDFYAENQLNYVEELAERIPVLASGSNASPQQLARKFANFSLLIPVVKAQLLDFDVVYSAHFSGYGSMPATFYYSPGTVVNTFVTYLTGYQLEQMHQTEGIGFNYCFARLDRVQLNLENQMTLNQVQCYLSLHGCVLMKNSPICLSTISAKNRQFPEMNQVEVLSSAMVLLEPDNILDNFILETVKYQNLRKKRIQRFKQNAQLFNYKNYEILLT